MNFWKTDLSKAPNLEWLNVTLNNGNVCCSYHQYGTWIHWDDSFCYPIAFMKPKPYKKRDFMTLLKQSMWALIILAVMALLGFLTINAVCETVDRGEAIRKARCETGNYPAGYCRNLTIRADKD